MIPPAAWTCSAIAATTFGPKVIGGTKWPSITSTWITRRAGREHLADLRAEPREVRRQDRRRDLPRTDRVQRRLTGASRQSALSMLPWQWLQSTIAVVDMRTIVECSPQFGQTDRSS